MYHFDRIVPDPTDRKPHQIRRLRPYGNQLIPAGGRAVAGSNPVSLIAAGGLARAREGGVHAPVPVTLVVGAMHVPDPGGQPLVLDPACGSLAGRSLVIRGRRHAQGPADRLDPETVAMLIDIRAHFGRSGSSSFAKNTDADFKISFARRSS